jgi:translation initiation factor 1
MAGREPGKARGRRCTILAGFVGAGCAAAAATCGRLRASAGSRAPGGAVDAIGSNTAMRSSNLNGGLVYSTDAGRMCPGCRRPVAQCACRPAAPPAGDGVVRVFFETKGRGGKGVTVVRGLGLDDAALAPIAKQLKAACGVGGTVKDGAIELQGEHRDRVVALLQAQGRTVKKAGG